MFGLASLLYCLKLETEGTRNKIQCDFKYVKLDHLDLDNQMGNTLTLNTVKSECTKMLSKAIKRWSTEDLGK
jgi:hypothetical protein